MAEKARNKQRNLLVGAASQPTSNLKKRQGSPQSSRRTSGSRSQSRSAAHSHLQEFQQRLDNLESEQRHLHKSMHLGRSSTHCFDSKQYNLLARENAELQQELIKTKQ
jgi:hypothetical protein